jgi:uncharacterized protein YcbK (DUF882 family)
MGVIYNSSELELLERNRQLRNELIDMGMSKARQNGFQEKDIQALSTLLRDSDKTVHDTVDRRLKFDEVNAGKDMAKSIQELLISMSRNSVKNPTTNRDVTISDEYIPIDVVPGETSFDQELITYDNIMDNN